jgi:hypothetical protein
MTDTLDGIMAGSDPGGGVPEDEPGEFAVIPPNGRVCAKPDCDNLLPDGSAPARKYCEVHFVGAKGNARPKTEKVPKLVLELGGKAKGGGGTKDARAEQTAQGAAAFVNLLATGFAMSGDMVCAGAMQAGAPAWGQAVGELSKYQPILATLFAPAGGDNQFGAILGVLLTTGAIVLPVMAHHGMLPESLGAKMAGTMVAAEQMAGDGSIPGAA